MHKKGGCKKKMMRQQKHYYCFGLPIALSPKKGQLEVYVKQKRRLGTSTVQHALNRKKNLKKETQTIQL